MKLVKMKGNVKQKKDTGHVRHSGWKFITRHLFVTVIENIKTTEKNDVVLFMTSQILKLILVFLSGCFLNMRPKMSEQKSKRTKRTKRDFKAYFSFFLKGFQLLKIVSDLWLGL